MHRYFSAFKHQRRKQHHKQTDKATELPGTIHLEERESGSEHETRTKQIHTQRRRQSLRQQSGRRKVYWGWKTVSEGGRNEGAQKTLSPGGAFGWVAWARQLDLLLPIPCDDEEKRAPTETCVNENRAG